MHIPPHDNANRPIVDVDHPKVPLTFFKYLPAFDTVEHVLEY